MSHSTARPWSGPTGTRATAAAAATVAAAVLSVPVANAIIQAAIDHPASGPYSLAAADFSPIMQSTIPGVLVPPGRVDGAGSPSERRNLVTGAIRAADVSESAQRIQVLPLPASAQPPTIRKADSAPGPGPSIWARAARLVAPPVPSRRATAVKVAMTAMGTPYVWGGTGNGGFDCSGLVQWAYRKAGILVPRTSREQSVFGTPIARDDLRVGDLVFFYSPVHHVGIYLGNGNVLHAPQTGDVVRISPLARMPLSGARRI